MKNLTKVQKLLAYILFITLELTFMHYSNVIASDLKGSYKCVPFYIQLQNGILFTVGNDEKIKMLNLNKNNKELSGLLGVINRKTLQEKSDEFASASESEKSKIDKTIRDNALLVKDKFSFELDVRSDESIFNSSGGQTKYKHMLLSSVGNRKIIVGLVGFTDENFEEQTFSAYNFFLKNFIREEQYDLDVIEELFEQMTKIYIGDLTQAKFLWDGWGWTQLEEDPDTKEVIFSTKSNILFNDFGFIDLLKAKCKK